MLILNNVLVKLQDYYAITQYYDNMRNLPS